MFSTIWDAVLRLFGRDTRGVFRFWNGRRWVHIDPIPAARTLLSHPEFAWDETPKLTGDDDPEIAADAIRISAQAARDAFGIPPFEQGGLTETECCQVLWSFQAYLGIQKKSGNGLPTSPQSTEPPLSDASAENAVSGSGSIGTESVSSGNGTLPRELQPVDQTA